MTQSQSPVQEIRFARGGQIRSERQGGSTFLIGRCASYGVLSSNLGGWFERIKPGAFRRALSEKQDVRHLINHDANFVLGRTAAGTTELTERGDGLHFRTKIGDRSYEQDLLKSVARGDVNECSFGFIARKSNWVDEPDPDNPDQARCVRELADLDLFDISTVTYPAYPGTNTAPSMRSMFPGGLPVEITERLAERERQPIELQLRAKQISLQVEFDEQRYREHRMELLRKEFPDA